MTVVTLNWTVPTTRTDGTSLPSSQVSGANIFDNGVHVGTVTGVTPTFTTSISVIGAHVFTVTTFDTDGNVSAVSNSVIVTVNPVLAPPSAITNLTAVVN